jgi:predicted transposase/invertase (TIGR01784 family)
MLPLDKPIESIEYQTGELIPELTEVLKHTIVDVRCTDSDQRQFIVKIQLLWSESFKSRVLLNASKAYVMQIDKAEEFKLLRPVYVLNFVNATFEKSEEMKNEYYHYYKIVNVKNTEKQIEGLEFIFVELPKFKPGNRAEKKIQELWLRFLAEVNESAKEIPRELLENELTREAVGYMEETTYTQGQLFTYDKWKIAAMTERSVIDDAFREGYAIGIKKGKAIGIGKAIGEHKKAVTVAKKALEMGMTVEDACKISGLSKKQIEELIGT